ncbi:MAG TPA: helix-turn-helix domain-containing protein [Edaphobacter sp.]|nr:helix-turn-helix domain-containing protein [Edaphobacter sp.]
MAVTFRVIWRNLSELFGVVSLDAGAERSVRGGSDLAMARIRLIQPYLEERRSLQLVAADANLSFRTARRWVSQYRKLGLAAFVRKAREDHGARKIVSPKIKAAIEGFALETPCRSEPFAADAPNSSEKLRHIPIKATHQS